MCLYYVRSLRDSLENVRECCSEFFKIELTAKVVDRVVSSPRRAFAKDSNRFKQILDPVWAHDT